MIEEAKVIYSNHKAVIDAWEKSEDAFKRALAASIKIASGVEIPVNT